MQDNKRKKIRVDIFHLAILLAIVMTGIMALPVYSNAAAGDIIINDKPYVLDEGGLNFRTDGTIVLNATPQSAPLGSISGIITSNGVPIQGTVVNLLPLNSTSGNGFPKYTTVDRTGKYSFSNLPPMTYEIIPVNPNYIFTPETVAKAIPLKINNVDTYDLTAVNISGYHVGQYVIYGRTSGMAVDHIRMTKVGSSVTALIPTHFKTDGVSDASYYFAGLEPNLNYEITLYDASNVVLTTGNVDALNGNSVLNFGSPSCSSTATTYQLGISSTGVTSGISVALTANSASQGNVTTPSTNKAFASGTSITLTAPSTDPAGYVFSSWSGACSSSTKTCTFTMGSAGGTATVNYAPPGSYTLNITSTGVMTGVSIGLSVNGVAQGNVSTSYSNTYANGTSITVTAPSTDPTGYTFQSWSNGCSSTTKTCTFTTGSAAKTVTANYTPTNPPPANYTTLTVNGNAKAFQHSLAPGESRYYTFTVPSTITKSIVVSESALTQYGLIKVMLQKNSNANIDAHFDAMLTGTWINGLYFTEYADGTLVWSKAGSSTGVFVSLSKSTINSRGIAQSIPGTYYVRMTNTSTLTVYYYAAVTGS